jgi:Flp pilus assembly protein TadG
MLKIKPLNVKTFASDERGAVAMLFSLMMTALFFLAGMAIDYNRAMNVRSRISDAADAAALAAGQDDEQRDRSSGAALLPRERQERGG